MPGKVVLQVLGCHAPQNALYPRLELLVDPKMTKSQDQRCDDWFA